MLPRVLRAAGVDVVHTPMFAGLARAPRPYVLTLHDLIPLEQPEALSRSAAWYWRRILPRAVRRADRIITDSEYSRGRILARFGLPSERVTTIPLAVDAHFRRIDDPALLAGVRDRYRLPSSFLLFVGMPSPRKNLVRVVQAFARLAPGVRGETRLVLAGPPGWRNGALEAAVAASGVADRIQRIGVVAEADLPAVYSLAQAAISVSLQEGFALPAVEALACETALLCSDTTAYPEVVGECAVRVDPEDVGAIADGLARVLDGNGDLDARRAAGVARAARFRWQATAAATAAVYRTVAAEALRP
jgi:glycosyltransferase involved in cell wall biosynthesis